MVERSLLRNKQEWIRFEIASATALPESSDTYDAVVSTQVLEYVHDIDSACSEAFRVLKPCGRGVFLATDWESIAWFSRNPARMKLVLDAFASHCAFTTLPRFFASHLRKAGFRVERIQSFPILNTSWNEQFYSCQVIPFISAYIRGQALLSDETLNAWEDELRALGTSGDYYFLSNRVFFEARKL